jgi:hypothetical protein
VRTLIWPLFDWSAWAQKATVVAGTANEGVALASIRSFVVAQPAYVVAGTKFEGADLAAVRFVGVGTASYCGG